MAHTPGPWRAILDKPQTQKQTRMAMVATPEGRTSIDCTGSGATYAADCANARLIAAAPDLLEALKIALDIADEWIHDELSGTSLMAAELEKLAPCRAALEKAEGKGG